MPNEQDHFGRRGAPATGIMQKTPNTLPLSMTAEEELPADVDEPPEPGRAPRPSPLTIRHSSQASFSKSKPRIDRKESLLTTALQSTSNVSSPVDDQQSPARGMSCVSTWSNNSISTAELTSDGGLTSPGTRACTPSPPLPSSTFHNMMPPFTRKPLERSISVVRHDEENIAVPQNVLPGTTGEQGVEATLGRKRCIMFACGKQAEKKPVEEVQKPTPPPPSEEPPKRTCTIKFACPTKISTEAPSKPKAPRPRAASPAPLSRRIPLSPKPSPRNHRDSDSTVRNSPVSVRKVPVIDRVRRLSMNSDLAHCEAYRFHEFASSEEEVEEWTQESTCHRSRLTVGDTLRIENNLRQLVEEAEEEALEDDDDEDDGMDADEEDDEDDDDDDDEDDDHDGSDAYSDATDEGFQTDDENGFAVSDDESDAGSNYNWWAPGASTAATSVDHIGHLRTKNHRTVSESSIGSLESRKGFQMFDRAEGPSLRRRKSRPVNIRGPSPELPDSTDFVCGTLDEDRPAEAAYMCTLERRRAAKHKPTPQDIDPTFPASDPELVDDDEEDEVDEVDKIASESDCVMLPGRMELTEGEPRGRRRSTIKQPPTLSPPPGRRNVYRSPPPTKRIVHRSPPPAKRAVHRSPPPPVKRSALRSPAPTKRAVHRSPQPPNGLFGTSPRRARSPAPVRLRSPPPTRRGSANMLASRQRTEMSIRFGGIGERPALITSASLPRTPIAAHHNPLEYDEDETSTNDMPVRRAIDIQVGLEKKRQRRKEQLYRKQHRKGVKEKRPPPPGRGAERMRGIGLQVAAHKGKTAAAFNPFQMATTPDQKDMHVLSV